MIRKILILIFVSILLAGCITSQPAEKGTLQLTSSPAGAEIYLDNQYQGKHPQHDFRGRAREPYPRIPLERVQELEVGRHGTSGTSNYFAALTAQPGSEQGTDISPAATTDVPAAVTVRVSREQMIVGDSNMFSGTATGTSSVTLTLFGPGYYANGVVLESGKTRCRSMLELYVEPGDQDPVGNLYHRCR